MGLYLVQETFKPEAWNFFLENPGAAEGWTTLFTKNFETMNDKLHGLWFSHTNCNLIMIVEMPNDQDMTTILITAFSRRLVQAMEVTPLWSADDLPKVLNKVSDVSPPVSSQLKYPPDTSVSKQT